MSRWSTSAPLSARLRVALAAVVLLAAQLALFAHALGHDYTTDADQAHVVCGLCIAAQHLDHGVTPATIELHPGAPLEPSAPRAYTRVVHAAAAPFLARAPPFTPASEVVVRRAAALLAWHAAWVCPSGAGPKLRRPVGVKFHAAVSPAPAGRRTAGVLRRHEPGGRH